MINSNSTYQDFRKYFATIWKELPKTLDGEDRYYQTVGLNIEKWMKQLKKSEETNDIKIGSEVTTKLHIIYRDLQVKENWNKSLMTEQQYINKNGRIT